MNSQDTESKLIIIHVSYADASGCILSAECSPMVEVAESIGSILWFVLDGWQSSEWGNDEEIQKLLNVE